MKKDQAFFQRVRQVFSAMYFLIAIMFLFLAAPNAGFAKTKKEQKNTTQKSNSIADVFSFEASNETPQFTKKNFAFDEASYKNVFGSPRKKSNEQTPQFLYTSSDALEKESLGTFLLRCDGLGCKQTKYGDENNSTHLGFDLERAKGLLKNLREFKGMQGQVDLYKRKLELRGQEIDIYVLQIKQSKETIGAQAQRISFLEQSEKSLSSLLQTANTEIAKYKGERYKYLLIGFGVGAGVVLASGIVVGVVVATR